MKLLLFIFLLLATLCANGQHVVPTRRHSGSSSSSGPPLANLILWVAADDGVTNSSGTSPPANNDTVNRWKDKSGNNYHLTNSLGTSAMPTYKTSGVNSGSKPYVNFSGAAGVTMSNYLRGSSAYAQPNTLYLVEINNGSGSTFEEFDSAFNSTDRETVYTIGGGQFYMYAGQNSANLVGTIGIFDSAHWQVVTWQYNGASSLIRSNGVTIASSLNPGSQGLQGLCIGGRYDGAANDNIEIAEVLFYNAGHNTATMLQVEEYLGTKYGFAVP